MRCEALMEFARNADPRSFVFSKCLVVTKHTRNPEENSKAFTCAKHKGFPLLDTDCNWHSNTGTTWLVCLDLEEDEMIMRKLFWNKKDCRTSIFGAFDKRWGQWKITNREGGWANNNVAVVMISDKGGVYGKMKASVNPKLFSTQCPPHRLILASKAGQKQLPSDIESDTLFFFRTVLSDEMNLKVVSRAK